MRYGEWFKMYEVPANLIAAVEEFVRPIAREAALVEDPGGNTRRKSHVVWIKEANLLAPFLGLARVANREAEWEFEIDTLEPMQYTEYYAGDEYGWHTDQARTPYPDMRVRKLSFSIFLNNDFEGGEFDLEISGPNLELRYVSFTKLAPNSAVFFQSDMWHRVRPVTSGMRRSLVGWVLGKRFR